MACLESARIADHLYIKLGKVLNKLRFLKILVAIKIQYAVSRRGSCPE